MMSDFSECDQALPQNLEDKLDTETCLLLQLATDSLPEHILDPWPVLQEYALSRGNSCMCLVEVLNIN